MTVTKKKFNLLFKGTELVVAGKLKNSKTPDFNTTLNADSTEGNFYGPILVTCYDIPIVSPSDVQETRRIGNTIHLLIIFVKDEYAMINTICFVIGHLERLWAYLNIQQLMDKYELDKHENSTAKADALKLALEVCILYSLSRVLILLINILFSVFICNSSDIPSRRQT